MKRIFLASLLLLLPEIAGATTYYVATTGNDSTGTGSIGNPWRNPQKFVGILQPGDIGLVGDGTYTDTDSDGIVLYISSARSAIDGTSAQPITIKALNLHGAKLSMPSASTQNSYGVRVTKPYYIIEGFEIDGSGQTAQGSTSGYTAISLGESGGATGTVIRRNHIHDIARGVCSNSPIGNSGIGGQPGAGTIIQYNRINTVGRQLNGESGCSTTLWANDHGIYFWAVNNLTIHNNVFYDNARGYHIQIYKASQVSNGLNIYHNTLDQPTLTGVSQPLGCIILTYTNSNVNIKNNIFNNCPNGAALSWFAAATQTNVVLSYNLTDSSDSDMQNGGGKPSSGVTDSNNIVGSGSLGFTNLGANDYTVTAGSAAIDAGTSVGFAFNGSSSTIGAFDPPRFASCQVPFGASSKIQVTFTNNVAFPMLPASGATTFTARKNAVSDPLSGSVARVGDNIQEITVTNAYAAGNTADISWSSGNLTDSSLIGGTLNQPFITTLTNQSCANNAGSAPSYVLTQRWVQYRGVVGPEDTTDTRGDNTVQYEVVKGGAARVRFAVTCTGSDCPPTAFFLRYSFNSGPYTVIPDAYGADNIGMCGTHISNIGVINAEPTTAQISGVAGTFIPGGVLILSNAIPTISGLNTGFKTEMEYCVSFDTDASGTYAFELYEQNGTPLTYFQIADMVIVNPRAPAGF